MKAIIFDMYGTLVSSETNQAYKNFFQSLGLTREEIKYCVNLVLTEEFKSFEEIKNKIKPESEIDISELEKELEVEISSVVIFGDTYSVLNKLKEKYKLFLFSNLATPFKQPFYQLSLDKYIENPFFSCEIGHKKPDIEGYNYVISEIEKCGINRSEILMVGDGVNSDFNGAQNAGIKARLKNKDLSYILNDLF